METFELTSVITAGGLRLDFPTDRRLAALAMAWDDGANHQIAFLGKDRLASASGSGEFASMLASADLLLPADAKVADLAALPGKITPVRREVGIPPHRREYVDLYAPFETMAAGEHIGIFQPLRVLSTILSALELYGGSIFLIGGKPATLQTAEANIKSTFPSLRVVGRSRGDYPLNEEGAVMSAVQKSAPDLILVGSFVRGAGLWIPRHMRYTRSGLYLHDQAIIEILAGKE